MREQSDSKSEPGDNPHGGKPFFKKKGKQEEFQGSNFAGEFFKDVAFRTGKEELELYGRTIEHVGPYISTRFKMTLT